MTGPAKSPTPVVQKIRGADLIQCCHSEDRSEGGEFECGWATPGTGLAADVRRDMEAQLAADFSAVRIHTDRAAGRSALALSARAYTTGDHIVFRDGPPDTTTRSGRVMLAHELVHVLQQRAGGAVPADTSGPTRISSPTDMFEQQASSIASGLDRTRHLESQHLRSGGIAPAPRSAQRFEAPVHESAERVGLTTTTAGTADPAGFTNEEASAIYFGNWMRDLNQVFVPLAVKLVPPDVLFAALAYMAARKFGRNVNPEQFGYYIPAEHIDSPGGLTATDDLLSAPPTITTSPPTPGAVVKPNWAVTEQQSPAPQGEVKAGQPGLDAPLFSVDQAGVLAYIRRTNLHVERRLELAAQRGRTTDGMLHFGAALHAVEDLFAHSNWVEIAVNKVLAAHPDLLPELTGAERSTFTFMPTVEVGSGPPALRNRPVLTTGSFLSADTKISLTSEFIKFLRTPLPDPSTTAENKAEERFIEAELRTVGDQLKSNPQFRNGLRQTILGALGEYGRNPLTGAAVDGILKLPLADIYHIGTLLPAFIPQAVKDRTVVVVQKAVRRGIYENAMLPAAKRLEAEALGANVADTSLITVLRESQARKSRTSIPPAERAAMEAKEKATGVSVQQQEQEGRDEAARREKNLQGTPEPTLAGPSHSQIAKDHPNSPFFGIAFNLATIAVRRLRAKMIDAWVEAHGAAGRTQIGFDAGVWPAGSSAERDARDLFLETRARRILKEAESRQRGLRIMQRGNDGDQHYDLGAMRQESADQIRGVAAYLRALTATPDQAAAKLTQLNKWLGPIANGDPELTKVREELASAATTAQAAGQGAPVVAIGALADQLDADAKMVQDATTQQQRQAAYARLAQSRNAAVRTLGTAPAAQSAGATTILIMLNQQIADTAPAFYTEQREVAEGRTHLAEHSGAKTYARRDVVLPTLAAKTPALRALLEESRVLLNHPYENSWWEADVIAHIRAHRQQLVTDVKARTTGVPTLRRTGRTRAERHAENEAP